MNAKILTLAFAGLLVSAVAQDATPTPPPDETPPAPATEQTPPAATTTGEPDANAPGAAAQDGTVTLPAEAVAALVNAAGGGEQKKDAEPRDPNVILPADANHTARGIYDTNFQPPEKPLGTNGSPDSLRLNFRNAPLEMVLNYLSDAAGFIIVLDTRVNGTVNVISSQPLTRSEAVDLLNQVLNKNGYAAIRNGRTLTIVDKNEAKTRDIPVKTGNNPDEIPKTAEIVTQIIPIRFVEARQLVSDLTSFVSPQATVVANEAGNSIVITDTQQNIRHLIEIIKAIDGSAEAETEIRVFRLQHANPQDVATELGSIFPSGSSGGQSQSPIRFGGGGFGGGGGGFGGRFAGLFGGGGGPGGGGGGGGNNGGNSSNDRIKKATQVTAVADARIQAVIVTAPRDLMEQIAGMMKDLDVASTRDQKVYVFQMKNGDPQQAAQVLQNMFQGNNSRSSSSSSQNSALMQRAQNNSTTTTSSSGSSSGFGNTTGGGRGGAGGLQF
jgi:general secretion pathway protein D